MAIDENLDDTVLGLVKTSPGVLSPRDVELAVRGPGREAAGAVVQELLDSGRLALDDHLKLREPSYQLHQRDAIEWLDSLPTESVDLVVTDPAYESLEKHRARGTTTRLKMSNGSSNEWFDIFPNTRFVDLFDRLFRVLKKNTHCYMFCDQETAFFVKPIGEAAGFKFWKPLVWDKKRIGMGYHYRARYEFILFFEKGKRRLNNLGIGDVLEAPRVNGGYPTEKPVSLCETLILQSTQPGELVIDPFFGSGAAGVAAIKHGRVFAGADTSAKATSHAGTRLRNHEAALARLAGGV